ncbi:MAG: PaaI family thioesterase [Pseudomonadota bacterium]
MPIEFPENLAPLDFAQIADMTGLEQLQAMLEQKLPAPPIAKTLNFILHEVEEGRAVFRGEPLSAFLNPLGLIHGGWIATLLDSALGCAVQAKLNKGEGYTTADFNVHCVRAVMPDTGEMFCEGKIVHRGRRMATAEATLKDANGKLYAHGTETCFILDFTGGG